MRSQLPLAFLLILAWAALSGHYSLKPLIFVLGVASIALVLSLYSRLLAAVGVPPIHPQLLGMTLRAPRFLWTMARLVVKANLRVTRLLLDPRVDTEPRILRMKVGPRTDLGQFLYANAITLTPGTVTLDVRRGEVLVHALGPISAESVVSGELDRAVRRLEGAL